MKPQEVKEMSYEDFNKATLLISAEAEAQKRQNNKMKAEAKMRK